MAYWLRNLQNDTRSVLKKIHSSIEKGIVMMNDVDNQMTKSLDTSKTDKQVECMEVKIDSLKANDNRSFTSSKSKWTMDSYFKFQISIELSTNPISQ